MKRIFVPTKSGSDWQARLAKPTLHWKAGRSAMAAAACWEACHPKLPSDISATLDAGQDESLKGLELLAVIPEWEVKLPGGERNSQTDVLALVRNDTGLIVIGVEAKVDEPFGPTLGEKRRDASPGQLDRIAYLQQELHSGSPLPDEIRYQLLHRTVSALLTARAFHSRTAVMLVQSFSRTNKWRPDFDAFTKAVGGTPLTEDLFELQTGQSPRLLIGWSRGSCEFLEAELPGSF